MMNMQNTLFSIEIHLLNKFSVRWEQIRHVSMWWGPAWLSAPFYTSMLCAVSPLLCREEPFLLYQRKCDPRNATVQIGFLQVLLLIEQCNCGPIVRLWNRNKQGVLWFHYNATFLTKPFHSCISESLGTIHAGAFHVEKGELCITKTKVWVAILEFQTTL